MDVLRFEIIFAINVERDGQKNIKKLGTTFVAAKLI